MGNGAVRSQKEGGTSHASTDDVELQVAHYIHPIFQLEVAELTQAQIKTCKDTFAVIAGGQTDMYQTKIRQRTPNRRSRSKSRSNQGGRCQTEKQRENDEGDAKEKELGDDHQNNHLEDELESRSLSTNGTDPLTFMVSDFYNTLYERIPATKDLFMSEVKVQAALLGRMIHTILSLVERKDTQVCQKLLRDVARAHNNYDVHPAFYGEFAYTFVCTLRRHLGEGRFGARENRCWVAFWSYVLRAMVPVCVAGTRHLGPACTITQLRIPPGALQLSVGKTLEEEQLVGALARGEEEENNGGPLPTGAEVTTATT